MHNPNHCVDLTLSTRLSPLDSTPAQVAAAIVQKKISDDAAAAAKLYVGTALVVAFASDVVREPVACAGGIEIVCGVLLLLRAREAREWAETRRRLVREGTLAKDK